MQSRLRPAALVVVLAAVLAPGAARAQDTARVSPDSARLADSLRARGRPLAPVVVTALRGAAPLATVPFAVTVREGADLHRGRPGLALDEALRGVPGVQVDNRYNYAIGERISIRGLGARAQFGVRGVRVIVDGVPATLPDGQTTLSHLDVGALRRVEVLSGPASSLYGNAAGGVIVLETAGPAAGPPSGEAGTTVGANGLRRAHLRLGGRTGGGTGPGSYAASVSRLTSEGWRAHSEAQSTWASARLGWDGGAAGRLRLSFAGVDYDALNPGSLSDSLLGVDRRQAFANNVRQRTGETGRQGQLGASWHRGVGGRELELSGYALRRELENPIPSRIIDLERDGGGARVLLRSTAARLRWTAGVEADAQRDDRRNSVNLEGERGVLALDQLERVASFGTFAQATATVAPRIELVAGARWDRVRFAVRDRFVNDTNPDDSGERWMGAVSPSAGLSVSLREGLVLYANAGTAFETPTTTELANRESGAGGFNDELQPQRTLSYETGLRGRLPWRGTFQLAAYDASVRDALIPFEVPGTPGRQFFRNAGRTRNRGLEAAASVAPAAWLRVDASWSRTDARFSDYETGGRAFDGNRVPGIAPWRLDGALVVNAPAGVFASVETRYVARMAADDANTAFAPPSAVTDLRAGVDDVRVGRASVRVFAGLQNALDREYVSSVVVNAFGRRYFEPAPDRAFYAGAALAFGGR